MCDMSFVTEVVFYVDFHICCTLVLHDSDSFLFCKECCKFTVYVVFMYRPIYYLSSSHAGTVVPECFKDDNASQWKSGKFDPLSLRNP